MTIIPVVLRVVRSITLLFTLSFTLSFAVDEVRAQPPPSPDAVEADRLFEEGRALAKEKQYAEACERFTRSFKLDPTVGTQLNLADCHEQLGHLREAWQLFLAAAEQSERTTDEKRTKFARDRADAVAARLATIVITVTQPTTPGLVIRIGGREVAAAAELRDRVDPGEVEITAVVPERPAFTTSVKATSGATIQVTIPTFELPTVPTSTGTRRDRSRVRLAWGLAGASGALAIAATILTLKGRSDYNATADGPDCMRVTGGIICNPAGDAKIGDAQRLADVGTVFAIGCGVFLAASASVYFTAPREPIVVPTATGQSIGVAVTGAF